MGNIEYLYKEFSLLPYVGDRIYKLIAARQYNLLVDKKLKIGILMVLIAKKRLQKVIVLAFALLSLSIATSVQADNRNHVFSSSSIKTDTDLYQQCSNDIQVKTFSGTKCEVYIDGFLSAYVAVFMNTAGRMEHIRNIALPPSPEKAKIDENVEGFFNDFGYLKCNRSDSPLIIAKAFITFMNEKKDKGDVVPQHPGGFFWHYLSTCKPTLNK